MNEAKKNILNQIRAAFGRQEPCEEAKRALREKLAIPARSVTPHRVRLSGPELIQEFIRMTTGEATTVFRVETGENVPKAVTTFLGELGLPHSLVLSPDKSLERMPWDKSDIQIRIGRAENDDPTSVTPGFAAVAETGCLLLLSGPSHPYTLNFLPENHIVVLESSRIVATPEDAFGLLREEFGPGRMPRTALMVAGPSRSADIDTSLQFGAHGPKRLHCILIG